MVAYLELIKRDPEAVHLVSGHICMSGNKAVSQLHKVLGIQNYDGDKILRKSIRIYCLQISSLITWFMCCLDGKKYMVEREIKK